VRGKLSRRSKLELYLDILRALASDGSLNLTHLMYSVNIRCSIIKQYLKCLLEKDLIERMTTREHRSFYAITTKGWAVLVSYQELTKALPIIRTDEDEYAVIADCTP